jgi:hypothetical protein
MQVHGKRADTPHSDRVRRQLGGSQRHRRVLLT